jgi:ADP-heptose:LPS heptosyltransferase
MSNIIIAPFSNSDIRDWPVPSFIELTRLLLARWPGPGVIRVIGTTAQSIRACDIVREFDAVRVWNDCGRLTWSEVLREIRRAICVVGNNSGIAHLSGYFGTPTVCIFSASHQRLEWRPRGFGIITVSEAIGCSPCHLDHGDTCPYNKVCLRKIEPSTVADLVLRLIADREASAGMGARGWVEQRDA